MAHVNKRNVYNRLMSSTRERERERGTHTPKAAPKQDPRVPPPQSPELQRGWGTVRETETQVNTTSLDVCIRQAHAMCVCVAYTLLFNKIGAKSI